MARVLVLTDRQPADFEWKGAFAWDLIRSLAESQHQVLVLTTEDPGQIEVSHPRLTIARPAKSWGVQNLPKFLQAILMFRPEVICTITPQASSLPKGLSIWPYLHSACNVMPKIQRFSTFFESADVEKNPAVLSWHQGSKSCIVFTGNQRQQLRRLHPGNIDVSPFEMQLHHDEDLQPSAEPYVFIPAPVSEWASPAKNLDTLRDHLLKNPGLHARINGGWGEWPASERRSAWQLLMPVADRLQLLEPLALLPMIEQVRGSQSLWMDGLVHDSWRDIVSRFVAQQFNKALPDSRPALPTGSTANFLSRLFAGTFEPWPQH